MEACHCLAWQWCRVVIRAGRSYQTEGQCQRVSVSALWAVVPVLLDVPRRQHHQSNVNISAWLFCCSGSWMSPSALWRFPVVGLVPPPPHQALGACEGGGREAEVICIHLRKNLFASCLTLLLLPLLLLLLLILTLFPGNVFPVTRCVGVVLHHCRSKLWDQ